jgi:hypothetical protein
MRITPENGFPGQRSDFEFGQYAPHGLYQRQLVNVAAKDQIRHIGQRKEWRALLVRVSGTTGSPTFTEFFQNGAMMGERTTDSTLPACPFSINDNRSTHKSLAVLAWSI